MDLFSQREILERYLGEHSTPEDPILKELSRHTFLNEVHPQMLSGPILGAFLSFMSKILSPERILEIGTYTGYSAICLARGLKEGGKLISIEINDELRETAAFFFEKAGLSKRIELIIGDALHIIPQLTDPFDLVFIDGHKESYLAYYELVVEQVKPGAYILADNVLWGGKVLDGQTGDPSTKSLDQFNKRVQADERVENILLPIRDGIMLMRRQ